MLWVVLLCFVAGCHDDLTAPPLSNDNDVVVCLSGPPSYAVSTPDSLLLQVGVSRALPRVIVYDSAGVVVSDVELGWSRSVSPGALDIDLAHWIVTALAPLSGFICPVATWKRPGYGGTFVFLGGCVKVRTL